MWVLIVITLLAPTGDTARFHTQGKTVSMQQFSSEESCKNAAKTTKQFLGQMDNAFCVKG